MEYRVFSHLSRAGYRVARHLPDLTVTSYERQIRLDQHLELKKTYSDTTVADQEIARPDLPPKKILDLSGNVEVLFKANSAISDQAGEIPSEKEEVLIIPPEKNKQPTKSSIEVIDLADSSEESSDESSSDSDIEIIEECPPRNNDKTIVKTEDYMKCEVYDDNGDIEIMEVPVPKKEITVTTIESSDSEQEDNEKESDSDQSYDGNWKRRQPGKRRRPFIRPPLMDSFKYLAVPEFCVDSNVNVRRGKENIQNGNTNNCFENEKSESLDSSDSVTFLRMEPTKSKPPFFVSKSRNEILDMMPSMARQKIMAVECPDLRLIPDTIKPKQNMYTYNTNSLKARLFSSFRPGYRGRRHFHGPMFNNYNPFYNNNNMFNSNQSSIRPLLPNPTLTQMFGSDIQSVARGMIQFASALLNNGVLPLNNQSNGTLPHGFQLNRVVNGPIHQSSGFNSQPVYDNSSRSFSTPSHIRFSDSPVSFNENFQQPLQNPSFGVSGDFSRNSGYNEYRQRPFTPQPRRRHGPGRSRPVGRNHVPHNSGRFSPPIANRAIECDVPAIEDPAYMRPDIPLREGEDRLGNKEDVIPFSKNNKKPIEVIDILDEDENLVPLEGISNRFTRKRKLTKKMIKNKSNKTKRFQSQNANKNKESTIIFLDSPTVASPSSDVPVKEEKTDSLNLSNISVKTETVSCEIPTVKQEVLQTCPHVDIKIEKTTVPVSVEINVGMGQIKTEPSSEGSVKLEQDNSTMDIKPDIPPIVKSEPSVSREEVAVKTEPSSSVVEESHSVMPDATPSITADVPLHRTFLDNESDSLTNEESNKMELGDVHNNELFEKSDTNTLVSVECNNSDFSSRQISENSSDLVDNTDSSEKEKEIISNDTCDRIKSWAEMKKQNVPLGRTKETVDEVDSSSEEDGEEVRPLIRPRHCKTIGKFQIFAK